MPVKSGLSSQMFGGVSVFYARRCTLNDAWTTGSRERIGVLPRSGQTYQRYAPAFKACAFPA